MDFSLSEYEYDKKIVKGVFISRPNRFIANVKIGDDIEECHVKNTGRLQELLVDGANYYLQESDNKNRKTKWSLIAIEHKNMIVNIDSQLPNKVIYNAFLNSLISGYENPDVIKREVTFGDSRPDLVVEKNDKKLYIEVKGCNLVIDDVAMFPDAKTARGTKHLNNLTDIVKNHKKMLW